MPRRVKRQLALATIASLVFSLTIAAFNVSVANADDGRLATKKAYIADAKHYVATEYPIARETGAPVGDGAGGLLAGGGPTRFGGTRANTQVNDPSLDTIHYVPGTRPYEKSTQSETSAVAQGRHIVVGYNSSADQPQRADGSYIHRHLSGYSYSDDGGKTWTSGFVPPNTGSGYTFGDPALAADRAGTVYYAGLGTTAGGALGAVIVNKSTDFGRTFAPAVVAAIDDGSDKEWIAVGMDPILRSRDNVYVPWTSFTADGSELWLARSIDGGATYTAKLLFAPVDDGIMSSYIQFANPVVDASTGRLYIPFLHFSNGDTDYVKVLVSDDGGLTFRFLAFNVPGAPDIFGFPNVTPGELVDCGTSGGLRNVLFQGADQGGGRFGLPRYRQATRLITQPSAAAAQGKLFIALNSNVSPFFGDGSLGSSIRLLSSFDGGATFSVATIVPSTAADKQHVHPSIASDNNGDQLTVGYYVQQANEQLRVDSTTVDSSKKTMKVGTTGHASNVAFDLTPSNNAYPLSNNPKFTTNYDRTIRACYDIGEYMSVTRGTDGNIFAAWGDNRQTWTSPGAQNGALASPAAGTHAQADVFFGRLD
jgi:hypothetical protein